MRKIDAAGLESPGGQTGVRSQKSAEMNAQKKFEDKMRVKMELKTFISRLAPKRNRSAYPIRRGK